MANVDISIDSIQMAVGEQTGLHVSATVRRGQKVLFTQYKPQQTLPSGLEVVDVPRVDTTDAGDGYITVTQHVTLTAWEDSLYYISPQKVIIDGKALQTKSLALKALTMEVDTVHTNQYYGPNDVQDNPFSWGEWSSVLWLSIFAIVIYVACWLAYIRLKSKKPISFKVRIRKIVPPHQKALSVIEQIKEEKIDSVDNKQQKLYYTKITDTLRTYMQERFGFNAMEMTSAEIVAELSKHETSDLAELTQLFETADLVKFAKYSVGISENDRNLLSAISFINDTKQENVPTEERIEPTITEKERQTMRVRVSLKWAIIIMITVLVAILTYLGWQLYDLRY